MIKLNNILCNFTFIIISGLNFCNSGFLKYKSRYSLLQPRKIKFLRLYVCTASLFHPISAHFTVFYWNRQIDENKGEVFF